MVIEPHMKQGRQHKLISTIFLATSVTKKLDHNNGSPGFEYLERHIDGQWYRLTYSQDIFPFNNLEFSLGGDSTGLQGSIVQKYDYYGTRLEAGTYRVVLEMKAKDGTPHYLAAEFDVE